MNLVGCHDGGQGNELLRIRLWDVCSNVQPPIIATYGVTHCEASDTIGCSSLSFINCRNLIIQMYHIISATSNIAHR